MYVRWQPVGGLLSALASSIVSQGSRFAWTSINRAGARAQGRHVEGQCGVEGDNVPLVTRPTTLLDLINQPIKQLAAGKLSSAVVMTTGV
jgi:hypothetical protein